MISKSYLEKQYLLNKQSVFEISQKLACSENKVNYWLAKHDIKKRSRSESAYIKANPKGDPFEKRTLKSHNDWFLYGLGLGLFWGEGNKVNKHAVRLGNTDPDLILKFIEFLEVIYSIDRKKLRFGLQIFTDINVNEALTFWQKKLGVNKNYFYKVLITKSHSKGTYRKKSKYGVVTVYFSNVKLRDSIITAIDELRGENLPT